MAMEHDGDKDDLDDLFDRLNSITTIDKILARFMISMGTEDRTETEILAKIQAALKADGEILARFGVKQVGANKRRRSRATVQRLERTWGRFGTILPPHARAKYFQPSLSDQVADCHEGLANARTRAGRARVIAWFTTLAFLTALDSLRMAIQRRLTDELAWVGKLLKL